MQRSLTVVSLVLAAACTPSAGTSSPAGMRATSPHEHDLDTSLVELARSAPRTGERPLLVVFPRTACSSSASAVIADDERRFLGALAPGTAALLTIPADDRMVTLFSSVEVTAPIGTWHDAERIALPPSPSGLVLTSKRWSARECDSGPYFDVRAATKEELEKRLADEDVEWLARAGGEGQAWLDTHERRVDEVLHTPATRPPGDATHLIFR